jgi:hypothetical protein
LKNIRIKFALLLMLFVSNQLVASDIRRYSASDSLSISEITAEEMQMYQADFFPLSLAEEGRQSAFSWRGMPPGFLDNYYQQLPLFNPLWGYWDNQHIPIEIIRNRLVDQPELLYHLIPVKVQEGLKPVTRLTFAQDIQFGLSYLDVKLSFFYRPGSFLNISANNFLRNGSAGEFSKINVNTYRVHLHHNFSKKINLDMHYWQIRHDFALSSFPVVLEVYDFNRVGHLLWSNFNYLPDSLESVTLTPYLYQWTEHYHTLNYSQQRKSDQYSAGFKGNYRKNIGDISLRLEGNIVRHDITKAMVLNSEGHLESEVTGALQLTRQKYWLEGKAGYHYTTYAGGNPELSFAWGWHPFSQLISTLSIYQKPQRIPIGAMNWQGYGISPLTNPILPARRGMAWYLQLHNVAGWNLKIEPYYNQFSDAQSYRPADSTFIQEDFDNPGFTVGLDKALWIIQLKNDFSYNLNYDSSFIPQVKNVLTVNIPFSLLKGALKLENFLIYQYIGPVRKFDYYPLVNQYSITSREAGNYHLLDAKILAHIKTATIYFIWENLVSQDYAIVDNYFEIYRLFRFGIYWTLFD